MNLYPRDPSLATAARRNLGDLFEMATPLDVLVATYRRPAALEVTLTSLCAQMFRDFRLVISDQTDGDPGYSVARENHDGAH